MYVRRHPIPILPPKSEIILLRESPACATLCRNLWMCLMFSTLTAQLFSRKFLYFISCWSALGILIHLTFADIIDEKNICFNTCLNANEIEHFSPCVQQPAFTDPLTCQWEVRCQMYNIEEQGHSPIHSFNKIFLECPLCARHRRYPYLWAGRVRRGREEQRKRAEHQHLRDKEWEFLLATQLEDKTRRLWRHRPRKILEGKGEKEGWQEEGWISQPWTLPSSQNSIGKHHSGAHTHLAPGPLGLYLVTSYFHETLYSAPLVLPVGLQNSLLSTSPMVP